MKHFFILIICTFFLVTISSSQRLEDLLTGQESLPELMSVVDTYYDDLAQQGLERRSGEPKLKHWKRYEWYMGGRLGPNGEFVNISDKLLKASKQLDRLEAQNTNRTTNSYWTFVGPHASQYSGNGTSGNGVGRVDRIAFHPTNANIVYVGTPAGGIWKTTNGGTTWSALDDYLPSLGVSGLVVSYSNPNTIYALTGDGDSNLSGGFVIGMGYIRPSVGVLKSTDGGINWTQTGTLASGSYLGYALSQSPTDPNILLAATTQGLYRTANGGISWTLVRTGTHYDVEFKPGNGSRAYATANSSAFFSNDGGASWTNAGFDVALCCNARVAIEVTNANSNYVYLLAGPATGPGTFNGIYRSTNSGANFTQLTNSPNILGGSSDGSADNDLNRYDLGITVSPTNVNTIVTAGILVFRSTNGGTVWGNISTYWEGADNSQYVHPDVHDVQYNPVGGKLYAASDGGLYMSSNNGTTWVNISTGIQATQFYHLAGRDANHVHLLGGAQDNGVKYRKTNSSTFDHVECCDGFDVAFSASSNAKFYASINQGVTRFTDNGDTRVGISPTTQWFQTVETHPTLNNIVFVGASNVYRSDNSGDSWTDTGADGSWALETCPSNTNRVYAAGGGGFGNNSNGTMWRSDFLGSSWVQLDNKPGFPSTFTKITDIAVRPNLSTTVYATFGGFSAGQKVYCSLDAGENWTNFSGSLPDIPINCAVVRSNGDVYVGTDLGVFYRGASMNDWIPFSNYLPRVVVTELVVNEALGVVRAGTFGRGVWSAGLSDGNCVENLVWSFNTTMSGDIYYEANNSIENESTISGGISTHVHFKAGNFIDLNEGFWAKNDGAIFSARIGACSTGGIPELIEENENTPIGKQESIPLNQTELEDLRRQNAVPEEVKKEN